MKSRWAKCSGGCFSSPLYTYKSETDTLSAHFCTSSHPPPPQRQCQQAGRVQECMKRWTVCAPMGQGWWSIRWLVVVGWPDLVWLLVWTLPACTQFPCWSLRITKWNGYTHSDMELALSWWQSVQSDPLTQAEALKGGLFAVLESFAKCRADTAVCALIFPSLKMY